MGEAGAHVACCLVGIPRPALEALFWVSLPSWTTERAVRPAFLPGADRVVDRAVPELGRARFCQLREA